MFKSNFRLLTAFILFAFVFAAVTPALAATTVSALTVENKTTKRVDIVLTGPREYTIYANPGRTLQEIQPGTYRYSYKACGQDVTGTLKAKSSKVKLKINACKTAKILIINRGSSNLFLQMYGPETYTFTVPPNSTFRATVVRGDYRYSATWCGSSKTGTVSAKSKSYRWTFWCS